MESEFGNNPISKQYFGSKIFGVLKKTRRKARQNPSSSSELDHHQSSAVDGVSCRRPTTLGTVECYFI
ncbi:hypothetical protein L2E82_34455 [Cichorium intybus]|uniref:Uncharacterized protein n=1 Tax=Cichorium intybus TaxID=13427 RepID=A0ACB9BM57_CICIN|nr:hypothetical protein L2E82_34455 [Cichorium intybus]